MQEAFKHAGNIVAEPSRIHLRTEDRHPLPLPLHLGTSRSGGIARWIVKALAPAISNPMGAGRFAVKLVRLGPYSN